MSDDQKADATLAAISLIQDFLRATASTAPAPVWAMLKRAQAHLEGQYARWLHGAAI